MIEKTNQTAKGATARMGGSEPEQPPVTMRMAKAFKFRCF
jgi:hypothetical protein